MPQPELTTYLKLCTEYYDLEQHRYDKDAQDFYMSYAQKTHGNILEPMCGTGRFLLPMLKARLNIEGFDASEHMLTALREKYAYIRQTQYKQPTTKPAPVWQQFIQDFISTKRYDLIFIPYGSWGLITEKSDIVRSLEIMYHHLTHNGTFLVEIETVASIPEGLGTWHRGLHKRPDGSYIALNTFPTYSAEEQLFKCICIYESLRNGTIEATETELFLQYLYQWNEFDELLAHAGFTHIKKLTPYTHTLLTDEKAPIIIYECKK